MSRQTKSLLVALLILFAVGMPARAGDRPDGSRVNFRMDLKAGAKHAVEHSRDVVQRTPEFSLWDGHKQIIPSRAGFIYRIEKVERDQLLISMPSQGLLGWVPRDAVVEYNQAEPVFTSELDLNDGTSFAHLMRAIVCQDNDHLDRSFADLNEAIRLDPRNVSAWIERAFLWQFRNRMDLAMADVNKAIQADPRCGEAFVERGVFHYTLKEYPQAFVDLDRAVELGSRSIFVYMTRGLMLLERKALDEAEAEFRHAIQVDPKNSDAYLSIGSIQLMKAKAAEAVTTFSRAIQLAPEKADAHSGRATAYLTLGQHKAALQDLNSAIQIEPLQPENLRNRGTVYSYLGEWDQALADVESSARIAPNDTDTQLVRAWMLATCPEARLRDGRKAVASATRACELTRWKVARPLASLAAAYAETGDYNSAVKWQQKAIELSTDDGPEKRTYQTGLERYRAGKPYHRVGLLEEWGVRRYHPSSKPSDNTSASVKASPAGNASASPSATSPGQP